MNVQEQKARRNALINNTNNYRTGEILHQVKTFQIGSMDDWELIGDTIRAADPQAGDFFDYPSNYIYNLLLDYENGIGNLNGDLRISMLQKYSNNTYTAIFFIYKSPHEHFIDGEMLRIQFEQDDNTFLSLSVIFDDTLVQEMSEYQMLTLVREEESAISLLDEFSAGFDSLRVYHGRALRFNEIDERLNNNDNDIDRQVNHNDIDEQYHEIQNLNENNIIPYWYENDQNFEQLLRLNNHFARG
jgi:hypothetical protein